VHLGGQADVEIMGQSMKQAAAHVPTKQETGPVHGEPAHLHHRSLIKDAA
jgi:hypothetical protein